MAPKALNNSKPPQNSVLPVPPSALRQAPAGARRILTRGLSFGGALYAASAEMGSAPGGRITLR